jgi:hypothetical protein
MPLQCGESFVAAARDGHLWIVCSDPASDPVVIFNLTTYTPDEESVCVFDVGDHPFVRHKSAIRYWEGKCVPPAKLEELLKSGLVRNHQCATEEMLTKIWYGAALSRFIKPPVLQVLENQCLLPD